MNDRRSEGLEPGVLDLLDYWQKVTLASVRRTADKKKAGQEAGED